MKSIGSNQLKLIQGELGKQHGMASTADAEQRRGDWMERAAAVVVVIAKYRMEFTPDDIRHFVVNKIGEPHSPKVWGALSSVAQRAGVMKKSGRWTHTTFPQAHRRDIPVYKSLLYKGDSK